MSEAFRKMRLDQHLQELYPAYSRSRIQAEIMAGRVRVEGMILDKPGTLVDRSAEIIIKQPEHCYVSRGGLKLEKALDSFGLNPAGLTVIDVGASTGGFTDCLLQNGARLVYALDVGYGQLNYRLRRDPRVTVLERFNVRRLGPGDLQVVPDLAVVDVSFISLKMVFPVLSACSVSTVVALVKPQFEVGRAEANRGKGVIRDPALHRSVLNRVFADALYCAYHPVGVTYSPCPGPKGNIEFLICLKSAEVPRAESEEPIEALIEKSVYDAHREFHNVKQQAGRRKNDRFAE